MNRVDRMGIELEAGWHLPFNDSYRKPSPGIWDNWSIESDGSIHSKRGRSLEIISNPLTPARLKKAVKDIMPFISEVNKSMGFHIHVSLKSNDDYMDLCSMRFVDFFLSSLSHNKGIPQVAIKRRLHNSFCHYDYSGQDWESKTIDIQLGLTGKSSDRYRAINFCKNFHGTIEFRIFPASKSTQTVLRFINFTVKTINEYLNNWMGNHLELQEKAEIDDSEIENVEIESEVI